MSEDVCRMCLIKGNKTNLVDINFGEPTIKRKLMVVIPDMNTDMLLDSVICSSCMTALNISYQLKMKCLEVEDKIQRYIAKGMANRSITPPISLIKLFPAHELMTAREEITVEPNVQHYTSNLSSPTYITLESSHQRLRESVQRAKVEQLGGFVCTTCKQCFNTRPELHSHILIHLGTKPHMCTYCYKCFTLKANLQIHLRTHTQDKPYSCDECGKRFTTSGNLKTHTRVHTKERPFACNICDKTFIQKAQLNMHTLLHRNTNEFSCKVCDKAFTTKASLQVHARIHEDYKPFVCDHCYKGFTTNGNLMIHMRTHTGIKPYVCKECGMAFTQANQLKIHTLKCEQDCVVVT